MTLKVLNIITGSISAYKNIDMLRAAQSFGFQVEVILTQSASRFVPHDVLETFCQGKVWSDDVFAAEQDGQMRHIRLAKEADVIMVAPASADFIAKMSLGLGDTLSLATLLATQKPIVVAPAMNPAMWNHKATQQHVATLKDRGVHFCGPVFGTVACQDIGYGKYVEADALLTLIRKLLLAPTYEGSFLDQKERPPLDKKARHIIITLGNTREYIDPVRYIGNISSGATGMALAEAFATLGCRVSLVAGYIDPSVEPLLHQFEHARAYTAQQMLEASLDFLPAHGYIACAAVCDIKPAVYSKTKLKKNDGLACIHFEKNIDVVQAISELNHQQRPEQVVGFALESEDGTFKAQQKLKDKKLDAIILNSADHLFSQEKAFSWITNSSKEALGILTLSKMATFVAQKVLQSFPA